MKIKFIRECKDKNTGARYHIGDELVFPVERAKEILATGYAVKIEEESQGVKEEVKPVKKTRDRKKANN